MTIELLKSNIEKQKKLFLELGKLYRVLRFSNNVRQKNQIRKAIISNLNLMKMLNRSIPNLVNNISLISKLPGEVKRIPKPNVELGEDYVFFTDYKINRYGDAVISISPSERKKYIKELDIHEKYIKKLKGKSNLQENFGEEYRPPNSFVSLANKLFFNTSSDLVDKGNFRDISNHLKKGGFVFLLKSYISVVLFATFLSVFISIFTALIFFFFSFGGGQFISIINFSEVNLVSRGLIALLILFGIPVLTFFSVLYYPYTEVSTLASKMESELPFVVIQMSAIATSDVEPTNIFKIISKNKDSPALAKEAKKIVNQVNLFGFDLTTALKNVADASPSVKWTELLNGMSSTILSGGSLGNYLSKTSESLLFHYRIEKEKATKFAETFMGLYISIVIAAPMLIMLLLIIMSVAGVGPEIGVLGIAVLISSVVGLVNFIFIFYLFNTQKGF